MIKNNIVCSGCGTCAGVCNCIEMELNSDGFYEPQLKGKCSGCGLCEKVCPFKHRTENRHVFIKKDSVFGRYLRIYSAWSKNDNIRKQSSTAGFIRTFVTSIIDRYDGVIALTTTDKPLEPTIELLKEKEEIFKKMAKSTYFAVEYSKAIEILKKNKGKFIVIGLPCQIAGIKNFNKILKREIFSIELFCGAVYSHNLMKKYFEIKEITPDYLDFKDKSSGWHNISLALHAREDGTDKKRTVITNANDDEFYFAQRNRFCTQEACLKCKYCFNGTADIQVGDFWGEKFKYNEDGVNLVVVRSRYANFLLKKCKNISVEKCSIDDLYNSQPWFVEANKRIENYENNVDQDDINSLTNKLKLNRIMQDYVNNSLKISELRRVYEINKRKLEMKNKQYDNSFVIVPSDCSSMLSFGDQAMNAAVLNNIYEKYPDAKVAYFSFYNNKDFVEFEQDYGFKIDMLRPNENETRSFIERFKEQTEKYQTLIVIGADVMDGGCSIEQAVNYYKIIFEALYSGKKVIISGMSFNTSNYPEIIEELINVSYAGAIINVRDDISYSRLKQLGCQNLVQVADVAFLFDEKKYKTSEFAEDLKIILENYKKQNKKIIAIHLTATKEKADVFIDKVVKSLENHKDAIFVAFSQDYRVYDSLLADEIMCNKICEKMNELGFETINAYQLQNEIDVKSVIGLCDLLITCRMHIAIAAFSKNVPVISFVYQGKFEGLYNFYDLEQNLMFEKDNFEIEKLQNTVSYVLNNSLPEMIKEKNKKVFELSKKNFEFLDLKD